VTTRGTEPLARVLGDKTAKALAPLGLSTVEDLLRHYPRRYDEPGRFTDLAHLAEGEHVTVMASVAQVSERRMRSREGWLVSVSITDGRARLSLTFFPQRLHVLKSLKGRLQPGRTGLFTGTVRVYRGERQLVHPDFLLLDEVEEELTALLQDSRPIPVYPASAAIPSWRIQKAVRTVLDPLQESDLPDPIPAPLRAQLRLPGLVDALRRLHRPEDTGDWQQARERMRFEEAFVLQVALARRRAEIAHLNATPRPARVDGLLAAFDARLPFTLTRGQNAVGAEIAVELAGKRPMQRLLQGEVGSGKTVVALRAMLQVVDAGGQAALLAPTEVLAAQHLRSITDLLGPLAEAGMLGGAEVATRVALLTGSQGAAARRKALLEAASGAAGIVVGTHALLSEGVQFADLGLVVVDEQHRFGVEQRDALRAKADGVPHLLVMTATPIPRTVAMTTFGDLEVSTLREVPAGRKPVVTHVVPADNAAWLSRVWTRAREEIDAGRRVFVVCPRISADEDPASQADDELSATDELSTAGDGAPVEDGERRRGRAAERAGQAELDAEARGRARPLAAVEDVAEALRNLPELAGVGIGVLHGRLTPEEKDRAMADLLSGEVGLLVSTTVIEVGVDVPQASLMVVRDAERFGLSQLHQLRGRVGRGSDAGLCLLVTAADPASPQRERLAALAATNDGFELARLDLQQRREGDVLGAAQSGRTSSLRLLRVLEDADLIARAREDAVALVARDPDLSRHPALASAIARTLDPERAEFLDRA
jgi:ATP-dependent DNA helicase RecG